jgi:hypothetical protein
MSANGISGLSTKQLKQKAKLDIASAKRQGKVVADDGTITGNADSTKPYYRTISFYDITQLPTQYNGNDITDNPNTGGLIDGRPWIALSAGISRSQYTGYYNNVATFFDALTPTATTVQTNFESTLTSGQTNISQQYLGYFKADYTGTWTFAGNSDDASTMWIGANAVTGYTIPNANANTTIGSWSFTVSLVAGQYYPIRVQFGNGPAGPGVLTITIAHTGLTATNVYTGLLFYNSTTNGF